MGILLSCSVPLQAEVKTSASLKHAIHALNEKINLLTTQLQKSETFDPAWQEKIKLQDEIIEYYLRSPEEPAGSLSPPKLKPNKKFIP